jgi:hypothetical protein
MVAVGFNPRYPISDSFRRGATVDKTGMKASRKKAIGIGLRSAVTLAEGGVQRARWALMKASDHT